MRCGFRTWLPRRALALAVAAAALTALSAADWPTYLGTTTRTAAGTDTTLSTANAGQLGEKWAHATGGSIAASATVVGNVAYVGSWDGYEYALNAATGALIWKTDLGQTTDSNCSPSTLGVTSSATVLNGTLYVGGGDSDWYALDATTGAVQWTVATGDNSPSGGHYNWSSPLVYNGNAYIGISSDCDDPLVQGQLLEVSLSSHAVVHTLNLVPSGHTGASVWTTPSIDTATNTVFIDTGNASTSSDPYGFAIVAVDASALTVKSSWKVPASQQGTDSDWGTSPTLFTDSSGDQLVGAINKNGILYAFSRSSLSSGPRWEDQVAQGGDCPECGDGSVSSMAFDGTTLYAAGGTTTVNGTSSAGAVRAINPATGSYTWQHATAAAVIPALAYDNGLVIDGNGPRLEVLNASTGSSLYTYTAGGTMYGAPSVADGQIFIGSTNDDEYAFGVAGASSCASGWSCADIGSPTPAGSQTMSGGSWTVTGGGSDIWSAADHFHFVWQTAGATGSVSLHLSSQGNSSSWAKAGAMVRATTDPGSPFYNVVATPGNGIAVQERATQGGNATMPVSISGSAPAWLAVGDNAGTFTAYTSADGSSWTAIAGSSASITMGSAPLAGIAVTSHDNQSTSAAAVDSVALTASPAPLSASGCASGWSCADVGSPAKAGGQSMSGTWSVSGGGTDIWNTSDQFHYVWKTGAATGSLSADVVSQGNSNAWAKAGVMLRASSAANAPFYDVMVTPGNGIAVQYRSASGGSAAMAATVSGTAPAFVAAGWTGNTYSAYTSPDGGTWTLVAGSARTLSLGSAPLEGLAVTSHDDQALSTATFSSVVLSTSSTPPSDTGCPSGWTCADIGSPAPAGGQSQSGGTWTVTGGGSDIQGTADHFHYLWQALAGDGAVSARVVSQGNSSAWAKAGVMVRASSDASAAYFAVFLTPGNGVTVQWRAASGGATSDLVYSGTTPLYLRVTRSGTGFAAYTSSDGSTWTLLANSGQNLPNLTGSLLQGLAVTSHNNQATSTATFDTVTTS